MVSVGDPTCCSPLDLLGGSHTFVVWGSQTELAYSRTGLTRALYAGSLIFLF